MDEEKEKWRDNRSSGRFGSTAKFEGSPHGSGLRSQRRAMEDEHTGESPRRVPASAADARPAGRPIAAASL